MGEECRQLLVSTVVNTPTRKLSGPHGSAQERTGAVRCRLGIYRTKNTAQIALAREMSDMVRRGLNNPATAGCAKHLRIRLREVWRSVAEEACMVAVTHARGLSHEATRPRR